MNRVAVSLALTIAIALAAPVAAAAGKPEPLSVEAAVDALQFAMFAPVALSPDGALVAYTIQDPRRITSDADERYHSYDRRGNSLFGAGCDVWLTDTSTGETRNLTESKGFAYYPAWSPDGKSLAFYSDRDGTAKLWIWERETNRFRKASDRIVRPLGTQAARWSPDGRRILFPALPEDMSIDQAADLFASDKPPAAPRAPGAPTVTLFEAKEKKETGLSWSLNTMVGDLVLLDAASGVARTVNQRVQSVWYQFSPDGRTIGVSNPVSYGTGNVFQPTYDFLAVDASTGARRVLAAHVPQAAGNQASFAPDGKTIAYCAGGDSPEAKRGDCFSVSIAGGAPRLLTPGDHPPFWSYAFREPKWATDPSGAAAVYLFAKGELWRAAADGSGARPLLKLPGSTIAEIVSPGGQRGRFWSPDGRSLTLVARDDTTKRVSAHRVELASGARTTLFQADAYFDDYTPSVYCDVSRDGTKLVYISQDARHPEDLWIVGAEWKEPRRLTRLNPEFDRASMGSTRVVEWRALDGEVLRGALLLPADYAEGQRYPTIVYPYGGSSRSKSLFEFGLSGKGTENMQLFASRGYVVFLPDTKTRPGTPMRDIADSVLSGVARLIELGIADPDRLGIMGHSYGGYSTLSVIVQSRMFRAAVARAGLFNLSGAYGDLGLQGSALNVQWAEGGQGSMGGSPWEFRSRYIENSPWFYLDRVETPVLIIHGAADLRVPVHNADQLFVALRRLGKPVMYARYDGEDHSELYWGHANRIDYCRRVVAWFDDHLNKPSPKESPSPAKP